jgi:hypothetical protein
MNLLHSITCLHIMRVLPNILLQCIAESFQFLVILWFFASLDGSSRSDALKEGRIKTIVEKLEKAELGAFNMETLKVTTNHLLSQVATVAGRQSCSSVNTVQNFVYTGDDVSSSMASSSLISTSSTSSTHGMTPCFSIYCGLKQFGEIPNYCCHSAPSFVNSLVGFACITQQGAI